MVAPPDDRNTLRVPFIYVPRGDPWPTQWIAEHPDYFTVPAVMMPRDPDGSRRPWAEIQALLRQTDPAWGTGPEPLPTPPPLAEAPRQSGSFAPPPPREKRMRGGQPWPKDRNGGDWPADRWGRPTRPLWDYPPGMRAPGEGDAPGAPGSVSEAEAIRSARTALTALNRAPRAMVAGDRAGTASDGTQTPRRGVASRYPGAYDVAEAGQGNKNILSDAVGGTGPQPHVLENPEHYLNQTFRNDYGVNCVAFPQSVAHAPTTPNWTDLGPATSNTPKGTWVGTFINGHFQGHVGAFDRMNPDATMVIFDQFVTQPKIGTRILTPQGTFVNNPRNYRVIGW